MVSLNTALVEDLGPGDLVQVRCIGCDHDVLLTCWMKPSLADLPSSAHALSRHWSAAAGRA
jgi:hypothetical protein